MARLNMVKFSGAHSPVISFSVFILLLIGSCQSHRRSSIEKDISKWITTPSGLQFLPYESGSGPRAREGMTALIHETTQLKDGTIITDTWSMNFPIRFELGADQVIDGLEEAVLDMRVGDRRKLIVPPSLSKRSEYPENGLFGPADTLYYDLILLQVQEK